jgi:hypothetical protein
MLTAKQEAIVGKSHYTVPFVKRELLSLWHEFWDSGEPTARANKANEDGSLGRTEFVEAANKAEAAKIVERMHPGCVVIRESVDKVG